MAFTYPIEFLVWILHKDGCRYIQKKSWLSIYTFKKSPEHPRLKLVDLSSRHDTCLCHKIHRVSSLYTEWALDCRRSGKATKWAVRDTRINGKLTIVEETVFHIFQVRQSGGRKTANQAGSEERGREGMFWKIDDYWQEKKSNFFPAVFTFNYSESRWATESTSAWVPQYVYVWLWFEKIDYSSIYFIYIILRLCNKVQLRHMHLIVIRKPDDDHKKKCQFYPQIYVLNKMHGPVHYFQWQKKRKCTPRASCR